jgi:E3 ubiquitin-protein ligase SHPRH
VALRQGTAAGSVDLIEEFESLDKGKGKAREVSEVPSERVDVEDADLPHSLVGEDHRKKRGALQLRLRECRLTLHRAKFLQGDIYHILGSSAEEDAAYSAAEKIRQNLLGGEFRAVFFALSV